MYMRRYLKMEPGKERETDPQTEDLRSMLMTFRISELQEVLCACGRPRSGRKHELLGRALSLLRQSEGTSLRERVKNRIVELYKLRFPSRALPASISAASLYSSTESSNKQTHERTHNNSVPGIMSSQTSSTKQSETSNERSKRSGYDKQSTIHNALLGRSSSLDDRPSSHSDRLTNYDPPKGHHSSSHDNLSRIQNRPTSRATTSEQRYQINGSSSCHDGMPVHPDVRFINLPFAELQDVLIKPTSLGQKRMSGYQDISLVFHLSPLQVQTITHSRSFSLQSRLEYNVQVLLRFCLAETSCVQEDSYPSRVSIKVNGKICPVPGQPPPNSQNMEPKKPHRPVNITSYCRLSPMMANQVQISWMPSDMGQRYAATVQLIKIVTSSTLVQRLKSKPLRNADHARALIKEQLAHDPDNEVATTSLKVSLCCPIGKTRMTMPCRATTCNHVQCFDGSLYVQMNERKPNWTCPVCDKKAYYDQLVIDGLFTEILRSSPGSNDIVFFQDGSWKSQSAIDERESKSAITTIISTPSNSSTSRAEEKQKDKECDVVDLTADSSDDDDDDETPPPPKRPLTYTTPTHHRGPRIRQVPMVSSSNLHPFHPFPIFDPDMPSQGSDYYSVLPEEERMAAELFLAQSGLLGQLSRHSPNDVIKLD